jgi:hypothetical protein
MSSAHFDKFPPFVLSARRLRAAVRRCLYIATRALQTQARLVATGGLEFACWGSAPGFGKTHLVNAACRAANVSFKPISLTSYHAGVQTLWQNRNLDVCTIDDSETLARQEELCNLAKQVFGSEHVCRVGHRKYYENEQNRISCDENKQLKYRPDWPPPIFQFRPRVMWLTNTDYRTMDNVSATMQPHLKALISRGLCPDWIPTDDPDECFEYCLWLGTDGGMLRSCGMSRTVTEDTLNWFWEHRNRLREISPRMLKDHIADISESRKRQDL